MAFARVLQACAKKSGFPTGVLCDVAWELQWYMAPLLVLNSDAIVEASLLIPIEGECRTSPTPEEEATLLDDIKPNIKHEIELPWVLEQLEICEQVQPAEQTATPMASLPSPPSQPSHLPSQKAMKPQERATRVDTISATQWDWAYLEENYRVPEWWREFWFLLQSLCDSAIHKLAHQQATTFQIPTVQLEKDGWWTAPSCLEVLWWRKYLPLKDFQGSHDYQEVRREETVNLAMALQSCTVQSWKLPGVLCGVMHELWQCLASLIEEDILPNLEMLDVVEKDLMAPAQASAPAFPTPDPEEEEQVVQIPEESCTSEPEEATHLEGGLDHVWDRYPAIPHAFAQSWANQTHAGLVRGIPLGVQLDLCSLGSLQVTICHGPAVGEVHYQYQSQVITQAALHLPQFEPSKPSDSPPRIQELWVNTMLFLSLMSDCTAPWPQKNDWQCFVVHPGWNRTSSPVTL